MQVTGGFWILPGEQTHEESFDVHLWIGHNSCIEIQKVNSAVPVEKHKCALKTLHTQFHIQFQEKATERTTTECQAVPVAWCQYLALTSWAASSTDCTEPTSRRSKSTWASGWEVRSAERAASARCRFLQARHSRSWPSSVSSLSHSARPMPLHTKQ